jgi:hypothetical protein
MAEVPKFDGKDFEALKKAARDLGEEVNFLDQSLEEYMKSLEKVAGNAENAIKMAKAQLRDFAKRAKEDSKNLLSEIEKLAGKNAGLMTAAFTKSTKAMGSQFSKLGATIDVDSKKIRTSMTNAFKGGGNGFSALKAGSKQFSEQLNKGLGSATNQIDILVKGGEELFKIFKKMDTSTSNLARSMNMTYEESWKVRMALRDSAISSGEMSATGESFSKSMVEMNAQLGTAARFDNERLKTYTKLRDVAKFEAEVLEDINRTSLASKQTQLDVTKNRLAQINLSKIQLGRQIDERKVMQDIAKASYNVKINYLGRDKDLAKAATQARALGMELSQTERIAESLMDFEGSIQKQMEAELLTGRTLNLERARYYALTNDITGLQTELNKQGITAEKFGKMNRIQQSAIADSMGMSKEEMSKMLVEQKALQNIGAGSLEEAKKKYELAVKNGTVDKYAKDLGEESLLRQFQQQSLQERMTMAIEKMVSLFEKLAVVFKPFYQAFVGFLELLGKSEALLKSVLVLVTAIAAKRLLGIGQGLFSRAGTAPGPMVAPFQGPGGASAIPPVGGSAVATAGATAGAMKSRNAVTKMARAGGGIKVPAPAPTNPLGLDPSTAKVVSSPIKSPSFMSRLGTSIGEKGGFLGAGKDFFAKSLAKNGGWGGLLKGNAITSVISGILAYGDFKDLMANPVNDQGGLLSKKELGRKVGGIVLGPLGSLFGGALGTLVGGPIGGFVGSFGGQWLANKLPEWFPNLISPLGETLLSATGNETYKNAPSLYEGGVVEKSGMINAHAGEVYTGGGTLKMFEGMWQEMKNQNQQLKEQNRYLAAIANKNTVLQLDRQVLATEMGKEVAMSYGNILNPGSQTFS